MKKNKKIKNRRRVYYQPCFPLVSLLSLLTDIQQTVDSTRCIYLFVWNKATSGET